MALIVGGTTVTGTQTLDATKLTGNLPEISGADLTNLPAPTATAIGTGTAGLQGDNVGAYVFCREYPGSGGSMNGTTPGGYLRPASAGPLHQTATLSGTWLRMGRTTNPVNNLENQHTLFLRQS